jgi:hypothetical protein
MTNTGEERAGPGTGSEDAGEHQVQEALSVLGRLDDMPISEHVPAFQDILRSLDAALASVADPAAVESDR